jgi:8-oxo-dGTP pyrophosphatase MutT (NUDIX family)
MSSVGWDLVHHALRRRPAVRLDVAAATRAAVAVVFRDARTGLELLFMRRAEHEDDPWSGHISFPGGRAEPGEELLATAIRETAEETEIDLGRHAEMLGTLDEIQAMARGRPVDLTISPFVFRLRRTQDGTPNQEVVSLHWLPLERLLAPECRSTMELSRKQSTLRVPCLRVDDLVIWGLTLRMFENLRELVEAARHE